MGSTCVSGKKQTVNQIAQLNKSKFNLNSIKNISQRKSFFFQERLKEYENHFLEFKNYQLYYSEKDSDKQNELFGQQGFSNLKEVCTSFLNSSGGQLLIGITDQEHLVLGLELSQINLDQIRVAFTGFFSHDLDPPIIDQQQYQIDFLPVKWKDSALPPLIDHYIIRITIYPQSQQQNQFYSLHVKEGWKFVVRGDAAKITLKPSQVLQYKRITIPIEFPILEPPEEAQTYFEKTQLFNCQFCSDTHRYSHERSHIVEIINIKEEKRENVLAILWSKQQFKDLFTIISREIIPYALQVTRFHILVRCISDQKAQELIKLVNQIFIDHEQDFQNFNIDNNNKILAEKIYPNQPKPQSKQIIQYVEKQQQNQQQNQHQQQSLNNNQVNPQSSNQKIELHQNNSKPDKSQNQQIVKKNANHSQAKDNIILVKGYQQNNTQDLINLFTQQFGNQVRINQFKKSIQLQCSDQDKCKKIYEEIQQFNSSQIYDKYYGEYKKIEITLLQQ